MFIAASSVRFRLSRVKIAELLATWLDVRLSVGGGSIDRRIREAGLACETMVEGLLADLRAAGVVNADETARRHAVIARRISCGTRTDEGSRTYAAFLSIDETCRRRNIDPWAVVVRAVANARNGTKLTSISVLSRESEMLHEGLSTGGLPAMIRVNHVDPHCVHDPEGSLNARR